MLRPATLALLLAMLLPSASRAATARPPSDPSFATAARRAKEALVTRHGAGQAPRIDRGVAQVLAAWRPADGEAAELQALLEAQFVADPVQLDALLDRFEQALEAIDGTVVEQHRALSRWAVLDVGPMMEVDKLLAAFDPGAHVVDDLFSTKLAFVALLNFPLTTLEQRLAEGARWSRRDWAAARLAGRVERRIPATVKQQVARATAAADMYVADDNIYVHHLLANGQRPFPKGLRLLSHWNLRDQIKAEYATPGGLARQRLLQRVMERIVTQTIPAAVIDDPRVDWDPETNAVRPAPAGEIETGAAPLGSVDDAREPDTRYARLLDTFHAARAVDPHVPTAPTHMTRKFEIDRELPEARVLALLEEVVSSPLVPRLARLIEARLGRKLEPFDLWYGGFRPRARRSEAELDAMVRKRYPTVEAFQQDLPNILAKLGFHADRARWLSERIKVDPARGSGHAAQAARRGDFPRLRTRFGPQGMDYKGFNIAIHELGHNVEQVFSLYEVDHTLLQGVPNTAFTEAIAFVFQRRDLEVLGQPGPTAEDERLLALDDLWATYEIAGVALVDIATWRWMYAHPEATPAQLREATLSIARDVWNRFYATSFGVKDVSLLAIYSHLIANFLYLPDYPIGHLIAAQVERHLASRRGLGAEVERMTRFGAVTPDLWMQNATGAPVGADALLTAAREALDALAPASRR